MATLNRFPLGAVVATPGALDVVNPLELNRLLHRHATGDWGDLGPEDRAANDAALHNGGRIFSAYQCASGQRIWVITEADRSSTCFLLPSEY